MENRQFPAAWIRELALKQLADADHDFDRSVAGLTEDQIRRIGRNTSLPLYPAHYWTHLCDEQYVSFIGGAENFERDLFSFCIRVGATALPGVNLNVSDGAVVPAGEYRYVDAMNGASIDKINNLFHKDFTLFGYRILGHRGYGRG